MLNLGVFRQSSASRRGVACALLLVLLVLTAGACASDEAATPAPSTGATSTTAPAGVECVPPVIGHRGEPDAVPEQTIDSFESSIGHGATTVEADVQFTADGTAVLLHDPTLDRTTDGTGALAETSAAEVAKLDAGSWMDKRWAGLKVPTLEEFLALAQERNVDVILELKRPGTTRSEIQTILADVDAHQMSKRTIIESFVPADLAIVRDVDPSVRTALITSAAKPADEARQSGPVIIAKYTVATAPQVKQWHQAGLSVLVWTPNDEAAWEQARDASVDGVMTDRTEAYQRWAERACGPTG